MTELDNLRVPAKNFDPSINAEWAKTPRIWVPSEKDGFVLAKIVGTADEKGSVDVEVCETGEKLRMSSDDMHKVNPPKFDRCEDMASMTCLNEPAVLENLKQRYNSNLIYTYSGLFCVVINPYRRLPIYTDSLAEQFKGIKRKDVPPHIFAVADEAYRNMLHNREDQSILCTGESGAGKTENTKKVIQYLAHVAGSRKTRSELMDLSHTSQRSFVGQLEEQLLQANPILEAFGNSKTIKNDNSSRFGKFVRIHFDSSGFICGANIEFYLLEKSRVLRQAAQERSFHIFYQLIRGASREMREELLLESSPSKYRFLTNGDMSIPGVDDAKAFQNTCDAMAIMGFSDDEVKAVFRVISALLLFGNLEFGPDGKNSDQAVITNDAVAQKIATLLNVDFTDLVKAFLKPKIKVHRDHAHRSQNEEQARFSVEAIAKATYERLFRWLVRRLNRSLDRTRQNAASFIGILDIAGFEIFEKNSFEQLCINYTNEKLQQLFNNTMFIREQQEYQDEGIEWDMIDFGLNLQPTIDLIEKPMGIMATLDDVCLFPGGNDTGLVERLVTQHQSHTKFIVPERRSASDFAVVHYAGRVDYRAAEWRVKNMDPLNECVVDVLQLSKNTLVAEIWKDTADMCKMSSADAADVSFGRPKKGLFRTVSQLYKEQLSSLMNTLNNTNPHFVRCIIPNHEKKAGHINSQLVLDQLRCNGVLEGIRICRQGFPNRLTFQEFRQRYGLLCPDAVANKYMDGREAATKLVQALEVTPKLYRVGQSKIFFRTGVVATLETQREQKLATIIEAFQAVARGSLARKRFARLREQGNAAQIIQRNCRSWAKLRDWQWWRLYTKVLPIVTADIKHEKLEEMEAELKTAEERLQRSEAIYNEAQQRVAALEDERDALQHRLTNEQMDRFEIAEEMSRVTALKKNIESRIEELERQLTHEEDARHSAEHEKNKLGQTIRHLEEKLCNEENSRQKMFLEKREIEKQLKDLEEIKLGADESSQRLIKDKQLLETKYQAAQERLNLLEEKKDELDKVCRTLSKENQALKLQVIEVKANLAQEMTEKAEELRKKHDRDMTELKDHVELMESAKIKAEKAKQKVQQEYDDLQRELAESKESTKDAERKQRRYDQQIEAEKNCTAQVQQSLYDAQQQMRELETKLLNSQKEVQTLQDTITALEKDKRNLRLEVDSLASDKVDVGKSYELESAKRRLEEEVEQLRKDNEELEDAVEGLEAAKSRLEVQFSHARQEWERQRREADDEDKTRPLKQKIRELEELLDDERRAKISIQNTKKSVEAENRSQLAEIESLKAEQIRVKNKLSRSEDRYQQIFHEAQTLKENILNETASTERMGKMYRQVKEQLEDSDANLTKEMQKARESRRQLQEAQETVENLQRELQSLKTRLQTERRVSMIGLTSRNRYGSTTSLNRVDELLSDESPRTFRTNFTHDDEQESVESYPSFSR